ncbi:glycosyltransferase family 2 protein [Rosenbergiella collisarenosi]|uniref:glycosyltransferase family 2 protein n=1 Tax=Rosenbergiella collisarenosi TaxID=1544695 RepID=UPI001F5013C0|nr:glycosyltransferase family 2 protein [Rosenbergiella collisarenosi]
MSVSIVTPVYNGQRFLKDLYANISSLLSDTVEWIIVNDCSTDDTLSILNDLSKERFVKVVNLEKNSGPGIARNEGAQHSDKNYIFLLDVDDVIYKNNFDDFIKFCDKNPRFDFYYAPLKLINSKSEVDSAARKLNFEGLKVKKVKNPIMYISNGFPQPSSLVIKRDFYLKNDIRNRLSWGEDFMLYLILAKYGEGIKWNNLVSFYYVDGYGRGSKLSLRKRMILSRDLLKISVKKGKVISSLFYTIYLTLRHILSYFYKLIFKRNKG